MHFIAFRTPEDIGMKKDSSKKNNGRFLSSESLGTLRSRMKNGSIREGN